MSFMSRSGPSSCQPNSRSPGAWFTALVLLSAFAGSVWAQQSGNPDVATYGPYTGLAYGRFPDVTQQRFRVHDAIALPNDSVVAAATCEAVGASTPGTRFCLVTWNAFGTATNTYIHSSPNNRVSPSANGAIARQQDGKFVVAAPCGSMTASSPDPNTFMCVARFNADFSSDSAFGLPGANTGVVMSESFSSSSFANAVAVQPDGKIIVAGQCGIASGTAMCAARYSAAGIPETGFGGGSFATRVMPTNRSISAYDVVKRIALAPDGKIYLGGYCNQQDNSYRACVTRLNADGSIDVGFNGSSGKPLILPQMGAASTTYDRIDDMIVQANGEFIFAGACLTADSFALVPCALRMGAPNSTQFTPGTWYLGAAASTGSSNLREPVVSGVDMAMVRVFLQADGKMLALLSKGDPSTDFVVRRYNEDGSRDANWAEVSFDFNRVADGQSFARGVALVQQYAGQILAVGTTANSSTGRPRIIRLENRANVGRNCSMDIDGDGVVSPTTDGLLLARAAAGMTANAVTASAVAPIGAKRNTWPLIRDYLIQQCGMSGVRP